MNTMLIEICLFYCFSFQNSTNCVKITMEYCRDIPYKEAIFPNLLNHRTQAEAAEEIQQYSLLVQIQCSPDFRFFLCSLYVPLCNSLGRPIPPCRYLCESSKAGCEKIMKRLGYRWPDVFDCDKFPVIPELCIGENRSNTDARNVKVVDHDVDECPLNMQVRTTAEYSLSIANETLKQCSLPCDADGDTEIFFDSRIRRFIRFWTGAWAVICCACTLFTVLTFSIDMGRFPYPVRPIFYLALCYLFISFVFMIGLVAENRISCAAVSYKNKPLVSQGMESSSCVLLGVIHYYFSTASSIWWVILCVAWFLAANLKWAQESIESLASYFHLLGWGVPALLCIMALISHSIDGDLFTGICSVGNLKPTTLFNMVFIPLFICIAFGLLFLGFGIISMVRIRKYIKVKHSSIDHNIRKLEKLMLRICAFAFMYTLPTMVSAVCIGYEAFMMENWLTRSVRCSNSVMNSKEMDPLRRSRCQQLQNVQKPEPMIYLFKYLFQLVIGITCAVWVCSSKTLESFSKAYARVFYGRSRVPTQIY
uniref:Frizzled-4 n=1 Tax=Syphacia muris TaxID=451379 RepID=A0A0N5AKD9_9BILA